MSLFAWINAVARIGFHASHEQFPPSELLGLVQEAEAAGFDCAMSSDHFKPWGRPQGHSGHSWSWLGAALASTRFPIGVIAAPGYYAYLYDFGAEDAPGPLGAAD